MAMYSFVIVFSIHELNALCSMGLCRNFTQYIFRRGDGLKCPWHEIFLRKYLAYHMYKPIPIEEKFQKAQNTVFSGPKVLLFYLKNVSWTGNELAGDDVEKLWELSVDTFKSLTSLVILYRSALKYSWNYDR